MASRDFEERLLRLEDIEAIKALKHQYCLYCDNDYDPEGLASLFTEDGVWDGGLFGVASGRDGIRKFFGETTKVVKFAIHHVTNPMIEVNGDTATGHWYLWQPMVMRDADQALWLAARYNETYRRVDGSWRFAHLDLGIRMLSPYEEGYGKLPIIDLPG
ncbi:MAG TPA: nuclear transport factor 2 family protein [Sneathiellales bacterium]|nr:nuclear transport factor 2 family protein [Sneathiellales bacterium]